MEAPQSSSSISASHLFLWGLGKEGQLGSGRFENENVPYLVQHCMINDGKKGRKKIKAPRISAISTGALFSCFISNEGYVFSCGSGKYGRLGHGNEENEMMFMRIERLVSLKVEIRSISCGEWHSAAVSNKGQVFTWGYAKNGGGLGHGNSVNQQEAFQPRLIEKLSNVAIKKAVCGFNLTGLITQNDELYMCGAFMNLGGDGSPYLASQNNDLHGKAVSDVSFGRRYLAVVANGQVYSWGQASSGALGLGARVKECVQPTRLPSLDHIVQISCSCSEHYPHTAALTKFGELWTWGSGYKGKLGHGNTEDVFEPKLVTTIEGRVCSVSSGGIHSGAITENGEILTFGCGSDGRLGHPEVEGHRYLYKEFMPRPLEWKTLRQQDIHPRDSQLSLSYYHSAVLVKQGDSNNNNSDTNNNNNSEQNNDNVNPQ